MSLKNYNQSDIKKLVGTQNAWCASQLLIGSGCSHGLYTSSNHAKVPSTSGSLELKVTAHQWDFSLKFKLAFVI